MPDELFVPQGWTGTTLGAIGRYLNGRAFKTSEWAKTGRPIIRIQDLTGSNRNPNLYEGAVEDRCVVRPGDFLISWSATLGAYIWDGPEAVLNQHIFKVESKINQRFHYHLVRDRIAELERKAHGSGMVHVTKGIFDNTPVAIPPDEGIQEQVAALIDSAEAKQQSAIQHLVSARRAIERFRQTVLAAACSGRLTADWRQGHLRLEASADDLLEELRPTSGRNLDRDSSSEGLPDLPETWRVATGAEAFVFVTSGSRGWAKYYSDDGPAFLRVGNLDRHRLDLDLTTVQAVAPPSSTESKRTRVQSGDLLISITADVGMVGVVPSNLGEGYVNQHVAIARPHPQLNSRFLAAFVAAPTHGEAQLDALQRGATKAGLGLNDIRVIHPGSLGSSVRWRPTLGCCLS